MAAEQRRGGRPDRRDQGGPDGRGGRRGRLGEGGSDGRDGRPGRRQQDRGGRDSRPAPSGQSGSGDRSREAGAARGPARPEVPADVEPDDLDSEVRRELSTLPKGLADIVATHLVAIARTIDEDPEAALVHARFARSRASRVAAVREAAGIAAYHAGEWSEAVGELRAAKRLSGRSTHLAVLADCERALGRPERALDVARSSEAKALMGAEAVELRIVAAGARRDLGQFEAAVVALQGADLETDAAQPWHARLRYAYADNLLAAGRSEDAIRWFLAAADADEADETDAAERASELGDRTPES